MNGFFVRSFGCRASQADGAALADGLREKGFEAAAEREAGLVVLNSCTVTAAADEEIRNAVRHVRRENPAARILVTGCYAQRAPEEIAALEGVTWVVGNSDKARIPERMAEGDEGAPYHGQIQVSDLFAGPSEFFEAAVTEAGGERTRPNLKIQDGCNNRCSFCVIPFVRGRSRSGTPEWVVEQVRVLAETNREVVLSGINLGRWGRERSGGMRLAGLVRRLLEETGIERLRLSSVEPMDFSDELLELMAGSPRIAKHVHAPLQSGCGAVLKRMRRKYRPGHYEERIRRARALMPEAAIGADVMAGFPGETEEEFEESRRFIESLPFTYLHVFTYSERPGTEAAARGEAVPMEVRRRRNRTLRELSEAKNREFRRSMVGRRLSVVTLREGALSGNFLKVKLAAARTRNRMIDVEIGGLTSDGLSERELLPVLEGRSACMVEDDLPAGGSFAK